MLMSVSEPISTWESEPTSMWELDLTSTLESESELEQV